MSLVDDIPATAWAWFYSKTDKYPCQSAQAIEEYVAVRKAPVKGVKTAL